MFSKFFLSFVRDFLPTTEFALSLAFQRLGLEEWECPNDEPASWTWTLPDSSLKGASHSFELRNPLLLPFQLWGLLIGLRGFFKLSRGTQTRTRLLRYSLFFFGAMNASSILCHNIFARYGMEWKIARLLDVVFTGSSAILLVILALPSHWTSPLLPKADGRTALTIFGILLVYNALTDAFLGPMPLPLTSDFTYLGAMLLATVSLLPNQHNFNPKGLQSKDYWISMLGLALVVLALPLDNVICWLSPSGSALRTTGLMLLFGGCDLAFLGLTSYIGHDVDSLPLEKSSASRKQSAKGD